MCITALELFNSTSESFDVVAFENGDEYSVELAVESLWKFYVQYWISDFFFLLILRH